MLSAAVQLRAAIDRARRLKIEQSIATGEIFTKQPEPELFKSKALVLQLLRKVVEPDSPKINVSSSILSKIPPTLQNDPEVSGAVAVAFMTDEEREYNAQLISSGEIFQMQPPPEIYNDVHLLVQLLEKKYYCLYYWSRISQKTRASGNRSGLNDGKSIASMTATGWP